MNVLERIDKLKTQKAGPKETRKELRLVYWLVKVAGGALSLILPGAIFIVAIIYLIPWIWRSLWPIVILRILSVPLIAILLIALSVLSWGLFRGISNLTEELACFLDDIFLGILIFITRSPRLFSQIRPIWAASLLLRLAIDKRITVLENMDTTQAWKALRIIEQKSETEFLALLKAVSKQKLRELIMLEPFSQKYRILRKLGIEMDVGRDKKPYITHDGFT